MSYRARCCCVLAIAFCALAGALAPVASASVTVERIIAKVDDDIIMLSELQDFVKAQLAPYKYPRAVEFLESLPLTATGKIQRGALRKLEKERAGAGAD